MGIIKDIQKNKTEIVRVEVTEFKGEKYLNLRIWYSDKETGEYRPSQKGIAIRPELYEDLKAAVLAAEQELLSS